MELSVGSCSGFGVARCDKSVGAGSGVGAGKVGSVGAGVGTGFVACGGAGLFSGLFGVSGGKLMG